MVTTINSLFSSFRFLLVILHNKFFLKQLYLYFLTIYNICIKYFREEWFPMHNHLTEENIKKLQEELNEINDMYGMMQA